MSFVVPAKRCTKCGELKPLSQFSRYKTAKDGLFYWCRACVSEYGKHWRAANLERAKAAVRKWQRAHPEKATAYVRKWQRANREKVVAYARKWQHANPAYRLANTTRGRVRKILRARGGTKHAKTFDALGYTPKQLAAYLTSTLPKGLTLQDALDSGFHIDHITPISAFNFTSTEDTDFRRAWALSNLRLIPGSENCRKGAKLLAPMQPSLGI